MPYHLKMQTIFDRTVEGIVKQGGPSMNEDKTMCAYRGDSGRKCAAGLFIPDSKYNESRMEGRSSSHYGVMSTLPIVSDNEKSSTYFWLDLQRAHDEAGRDEYEKTNYHGAAFFSRFRKRMSTFANTYDLNTEVFDRLKAEGYYC